MPVYQSVISLPAYRRGFHLITSIIEKELNSLGFAGKGICNLFIQHTSASLSINENADPDVRRDMEVFFNSLVPESFPDFEHTSEGRDDMPAHIKSSVLGASLSIPVTNGKLNMGIWQGVYLCEHRNYGGSRKIVITVYGG